MITPASRLFPSQPSLGFDLAILLDMDMLVRLKDSDFVIRELDAENAVSTIPRVSIGENTNVKPLISVNSCLISPPSDLALSFALVSSSAEAFSFKVT